MALSMHHSANSIASRLLTIRSMVSTKALIDLSMMPYALFYQDPSYDMAPTNLSLTPLMQCMD
jgi:hypothetical protein